MQRAVFPALLVVQYKLHRHLGMAWPGRIRRLRPVANHVARISVHGLRLFLSQCPRPPFKAREYSLFYLAIAKDVASLSNFPEYTVKTPPFAAIIKLVQVKAAQQKDPLNERLSDHPCSGHGPGLPRH